MLNFKQKNKNESEVKMGNKTDTMIKEIENQEKTDFLQSLKANDKLKANLSTALKSTNNLMNNTLPKLSNSLSAFIIEFNSKNKSNTKTSDSDIIQIKALREYCYTLVNYNRKDAVNTAFEMVVTRAIKLALMATDYKQEFNIDEKSNKIFVMSKVATPLIVEKLEGQKASDRKKPNTSTELVEVNTGIIDRVYKVKYPSKVSSRTPKTKDAKSELSFKELSNQFLKMLNKVSLLAKNKNAEFIDHVDEKTIESLGNIKAVFDSDYNNIRNTFNDYEIDINGEKLEKKVA